MKDVKPGSKIHYNGREHIIKEVVEEFIENGQRFAKVVLETATPGESGTTQRGGVLLIV